MSRLRAITKNDRLAGIVERLEHGEPAGMQNLAAVQPFEMARAGRAALLDALDREDEADANAKQLLGG